MSRDRRRPRAACPSRSQFERAGDSSAGRRGDDQTPPRSRRARTARRSRSECASPARRPARHRAAAPDQSCDRRSAIRRSRPAPAGSRAAETGARAPRGRRAPCAARLPRAAPCRRRRSQRARPRKTARPRETRCAVRRSARAARRSRDRPPGPSRWPVCTMPMACAIRSRGADSAAIEIVSAP